MAEAPVASPPPSSSSSTASDSTWRTIDVLQWAHQWFDAKGIPNARREAEWLLAETLGCKRIELYMYFDRPLSQEHRDEFRAMIQRRAAGEPLAYIVGNASFYGRTFTVTPDTLIPRPETEELVERCLKRGPGKHWLDIGTGTGVIPITIACENPDITLDAWDISGAALAVAQQNANTLDVATRIQFSECDALQAAPTKTYDTIISNPPYVADAHKADMSADVLDHEPHLALFGGGEAGEAFLEALLPKAYQWLTPGGLLALEIGFNQGEILLEYAQRLFVGSTATVEQDLAGKDRFLLITKADA